MRVQWVFVNVPTIIRKIFYILLQCGISSTSRIKELKLSLSFDDYCSVYHVCLKEVTARANNFALAFQNIILCMCQLKKYWTSRKPQMCNCICPLTYLRYLSYLYSLTPLAFFTFVQQHPPFSVDKLFTKLAVSSEGHHRRVPSVTWWPDGQNPFHALPPLPDAEEAVPFRTLRPAVVIPLLLVAVVCSGS